MKKSLIVCFIGMSLFASGCMAHHARVVPAKLVVKTTPKVVVTKPAKAKVVVKATPKVVVATPVAASIVVVKTKPKNGVCTKHGAVWHCKK